MKLSNPIKILVGLATAIYALFPILLIPIWFVAVIAAGMGAGAYQGQPPPQFFFLVFSLFPLIFLVNMLHLILIPFYMIHLIKNGNGRDVYRILLGLGLFYLPWLALPFYFLLYVWPDQPPSWALNLPFSPMPAVVPTPPAVKIVSSQPSQPSETSPGSSSAPVVESAPVDTSPEKGAKMRPPRRTAKTQAAPVTVETPRKAEAPDQPPADQDHTIISSKPPSGASGDQT